MLATGYCHKGTAGINSVLTILVQKCSLGEIDIFLSHFYIYLPSIMVYNIHKAIYFVNQKLIKNIKGAENEYVKGRTAGT